MKKNFLISLATFAVFASGASAASHQPDIIRLPTMVVEAPAYTRAERAVYTSLQSLKAQIAAPATITIELPALKAQVTPATQSRSVVRLAKS